MKNMILFVYLKTSISISKTTIGKMKRSFANLKKKHLQYKGDV